MFSVVTMLFFRFSNLNQHVNVNFKRSRSLFILFFLLLLTKCCFTQPSKKQTKKQKQERTTVSADTDKWHWTGEGQNLYGLLLYAFIPHAVGKTTTKTVFSFKKFTSPVNEDDSLKPCGEKDKVKTFRAFKLKKVKTWLFKIKKNKKRYLIKLLKLGGRKMMELLFKLVFQVRKADVLLLPNNIFALQRFEYWVFKQCSTFPWAKL